MACSPKIVINGYELIVNVGTHFCDGIVLSPNQYSLDDPAFIEALQIARDNYPVIYQYFMVDELASQFYRSSDDEIYKYIDHGPDSSLQDMLNQVEVALSQEWFEITPLMQRYIDALRKVIADREARERRRAEKATRRNRNAPGFVYLLETSLGHYKIGHTKNPKSQFNEFSVKLPFDINCVCLIETQDRYALEKELHARFDDQRVNGEWFALEPADVAYIKSLAEDVS